MRRASAAALARLRALAPAGSDLHRFAGLAVDDHLRVARGPADQAAPTRLHAPRTGDRGVLRIRPDLWPDGPEPEALLLLDGLARHLGDPGPTGRDAVAEEAVRAARRGPLPTGRIPSDRASLLQAIHGWEAARDPLRVRLAALLAAWDPHAAVPVRSREELVVAWRHHLERRALDARTPLAASVEVSGEQAALTTPAGPLPCPVPPEPTTTDPLAFVLAHPALRRGAVIGLAGPAGSGKSTLAAALAVALRAAGHPVARIEGDAHTWRGPGFRYVQHPGHRTERVEGPGLYDDRALEAAIRAARTGGRTVIVDAVYLGLAPAVRAVVDVLLLVDADPLLRLRDKQRRDTAPDAVRTIDVLTDFARKTFREGRDALPRIARVADAVWVRREGSDRP